MKRKIVWGGAVLVIAAVLAYFLWPMPLGEVLPEGETINVVYVKHILPGNGEVRQESTDYQLDADSEQAAQLRAALEGHTYHRTWGTILSDNSIDGPDEWVGYSLHLDAGGKSISSMGNGTVLINGCVYRVGYWGNQADLAWMEAVCAVLEL